MTDVLTCYCPRCQKDYQVAESSGEKSTPCEKPLIPKRFWLPSPQVRKLASSGFGSSPEPGQIHKQEFKPSWLSTPEWKWQWASDSRGILISPPPPILSKCPKQPKFTSDSWNWATCLCFLKLCGGCMLGLPHHEPAGCINLSMGMICSHCW